MKYIIITIVFAFTVILFQGVINSKVETIAKRDTKITSLKDSIQKSNERNETLLNYHQTAIEQNLIINECCKCSRAKKNNEKLQILTEKIK